MSDADDKRTCSKVLRAVDACLPSDSEYKGHFVFKDLCRHPDFSWYIQPVGFVSSVLLFPSLLFCGMFTTIQESALLDLKLSLKSHDKINIATRMKKMDDYNFRLVHTRITIDFVSRMAKKDFIKKLCATNASESEHLTASMFYYERYLASAITKELYYRNPLKYDSEYPTTAVVSKIIVSGIGASILALRLLPAISQVAEAVDGDNLTEKYKSGRGTFSSAFDAAKTVLSTRYRMVTFVARYYKPLGVVLGLANVVKIVEWGLETRK